MFSGQLLFKLTNLHIKPCKFVRASVGVGAMVCFEKRKEIKANIFMCFLSPT